MSILSQFLNELKQFSDPQKAEILSRFFQTGPGQYAEGEKFWGITVPVQRALIKKYYDLSLADLQILMASDIHEQRLSALLILVYQYQKNIHKQSDIIEFYLKNTRYYRNWDFVDLSAPQILGDYCFAQKKAGILQELAVSPEWQERRIAIVGSFAYIKKKNFDLSLAIAEKLLEDKHVLLHKATGWMLREIGKRDKSVLENFLEKWAGKMPRIMLSYALEKFNEEEKRHYRSQK
ncbi:MAG TPA: DNA alkylation repair protein [Candidatus Gracilibacteria bacterium]|nr:DNA alkylation repair protein [Candidatus Gracilibacteria bacterium]